MKFKILKNPGTRLIIELLYKYEGIEGFKKVQKALNAMGKNLVVDGRLGTMSINAIKSVNNKTLHEEIEKVFSGKVTKGKTKFEWVDFAIEELGVKEVQGKGNNPRVLQYHAVSGGFSEDSVPWCASFVNFIMIKAGYKGPKYPARAKSWLKFGKSSIKPVLGSIAVKSRKGGGHVAFVLGEDKSGEYVYCLGGNQSDAVNVKKYKKSAFLDFRVPTDIDLSGIGLPLYKGTSSLAGKES